MPGLVPGIHGLPFGEAKKAKGVDGRANPGHDALNLAAVREDSRYAVSFSFSHPTMVGMVVGELPMWPLS